MTWKRTLAASLAVTTMFAYSLSQASAASSVSTYTLLGKTSTSLAIQDPEVADLELGLQFRPARSGTVSAVRFLKTKGEANSHQVSLWDNTSGKKIASSNSTTETASGWQQVALTNPMSLSASKTYTVSYHAKRYMATNNYFISSMTVGPLTAPKNAGVFAYGNGMPARSFEASNYWVDIVFTTNSASKSTSASTPPAPTTSTSATAVREATKTTKPSVTSPLPAATTSPECANPKNPWQSLEACNWPGPKNTGFRSTQCPNGLTSNSGATTRVISITTDNTVVSCQRITGSLDVQAKNVVIRDSIVSYDGGGVGGSGVIKIENGASATVDHVEINGLNHTHSCLWHQGVSMTTTAINCHGVNDGIFSWADTKYSSATGDNFSISKSYFHDFTTNAANGHIDGYQTEGASNGVITHNTFLMTGDASSAISIWNSLRSASDITVQNNLMTGGGFTVYAEDYNPTEAAPTGGATVTNIFFKNNVFSTHSTGGCVGTYGVWFYRASWTYQGGPTDGWHRSGNTVLETGANIDNGNPKVNGRVCS